MVLKYPINNKLAAFCLNFCDLCLSALIFKKKRPITLPERLLISNIAHIGDAILTTSLLAPLKAAHPQMKIGVLVGSWSKPIFENHPLVNWVHVVDHWKINRSPKRKLLTYLRTRWTISKELRQIDYQAAIDCNFHFPNMAPLLFQSKIPFRIGFESAGFSPFLTHALAWNPKDNIPVVEAFFSLISLFPNVSRHKTLLKPTLKFFSERKEEYLVVHIGTGDSKKEWPLENWINLTQKLAQDHYTLVFTGKGAKENENIKQIISQIPNTWNLCDQLDWDSFVSVIQKAKLLIGLDSAASHVASSVQTPSLLLHPSIHPELVWRPYSPHTHVIRKNLACSPCFKGCVSMKCIRTITVEEVYTAVKSMSPRPTFPWPSSNRSSFSSCKRTT